MAWELIEKTNGQELCPPKSVIITSRAKPSKASNDNMPIYTLVLGRIVVQELGWEIEDAVKIFWGTDNQAGQAKIEQITTDAKGWLLRKGRGGTLKVSTSVYPDTTTGQSYDNEQIHHQVLDDARNKNKYLVLTLPKNFTAPLAVD
ncbi:MAG: hypothetical protein GY832_12195 [Chloroflexi bacterium]|nr:hypothetical protein [Chloroflexota bacterium]